MFTEDDLLPLSALQHLLFCERQCAASRQRQRSPVVMDDDTRKAVITAYQKRKQEEILHPFLGEKTTVGLLPYLQAALLARTLRGDLDGYPPFLWK